jgi:hypothetical protein
MTDEKIIDKITKLLAMAEGSPVQAEAETFMAKAQALMTQHSIELTMLRAKGEKRGEPIREQIKVAKTWFRPDVTLCGGIARANDCRIYYTSPYSFDSHGLVTIVGFPEDIENVKLLYGSLLIQLARFTRGMKSTEWGVSDNAYKRAFRYGFAVGIEDRLTKAHAEAVEEVAEYEGTLLPALLDKNEQVEAAMPDDLRSGRSVSIASADASRAGVAAAARADVGNSAVGNQRAIG